MVPTEFGLNFFSRLSKKSCMGHVSCFSNSLGFLTGDASAGFVSTGFAGAVSGSLRFLLVFGDFIGVIFLFFAFSTKSTICLALLLACFFFARMFYSVMETKYFVEHIGMGTLKA